MKLQNAEFRVLCLSKRLTDEVIGNYEESKKKTLFLEAELKWKNQKFIEMWNVIKSNFDNNLKHFNELTQNINKKFKKNIIHVLDN